jgi:hypothetical protein
MEYGRVVDHALMCRYVPIFANVYPNLPIYGIISMVNSVKIDPAEVVSTASTATLSAIVIIVVIIVVISHRHSHVRCPGLLILPEALSFALLRVNPPFSGRRFPYGIPI